MKSVKRNIIVIFFGCMSLLLSCEENIPPTCTIVTPAEGSVFFHGERFQVEIDAEDPDGTISHLKIFMDNNLLDSAVTMPMVLKINASDYSKGYHTLKATVVDNDLSENEREVTITIEGYYLSGAYHAEYDNFDSHGWKSVLDFTLTFDVIRDVDFNEDGEKKSEDSLYNARMLLTFGINPEMFTPLIEEAIEDATIVPEYVPFDAIAGATYSSTQANELTGAALQAAAARDPADIVLDQPD
jgi:major membrane immunogen (membrane-anchored lipoprotein)